MNDTITHKSSLRNMHEPSIKQAVKSMMSSHKKIRSSYRERYNSIDSSFFKTRADYVETKTPLPNLKPTYSAR